MEVRKINNKEIVIPSFEADDFESGTKPYEFIYQYHKDAFVEKQLLSRISKIAREKTKNSGFIGLYREFVKGKKSDDGIESNLTQFEWQDQELDIGEWYADDRGIWRYGKPDIEVACTHPIVPIKLLRNIDSSDLKVRLAYRRGKRNKKVWNEITVSSEITSNAKNIISLSKLGISVTSGKKAQNLVDYINDVIDRNYDVIPQGQLTSKMGWKDEGFSPYIDGIEFDTDSGFEKIFKTIHEQGSFDIWLDEVKKVRRYSLTARIILAASFASVLIGPVGCLPFFVHLWGMDSATGKTVGQMVAASVWGDPYVGGDFFRTFKSTSTAIEIIAGFLNSIPVLLDELQLTKDARGKVLFNVYELASGSGKSRSNKNLGLAGSITWNNCFITSGETPLTSESDGAGALNRVVEIECTADNKVVADGYKTAGIMKQNYGFAGRIFTDKLKEPDIMAMVKERYEKHYKELSLNDTTEKQAMAAALIVVADELATEWIFKDKMALTDNDISNFLKTKENVSAAERGYQVICDWVSKNGNKFCGKSDTMEVYGDIPKEPLGEDYGYVYIVRSVFNDVCSDNKISAPALLSHLRSRHLLKLNKFKKGFTRPKKINGIATNCVVMKLSDDTSDDNAPSGFVKAETDDDLPF